MATPLRADRRSAVYVAVRLTLEEKLRWKALAEREGRSLSNLIRRAVEQRIVDPRAHD